MAYADYHLCDSCGNKAFYDSNLRFADTRINGDYHGYLPIGCGSITALCLECSENYETTYVKRDKKAKVEQEF